MDLWPQLDAHLAAVEQLLREQLAIQRLHAELLPERLPTAAGSNQQTYLPSSTHLQRLSSRPSFRELLASNRRPFELTWDDEALDESYEGRRALTREAEAPDESYEGRRAFTWEDEAPDKSYEGRRASLAHLANVASSDTFKLENKLDAFQPRAPFQKSIVSGEEVLVRPEGMHSQVIWMLLLLGVLPVAHALPRWQRMYAAYCAVATTSQFLLALLYLVEIVTSWSQKGLLGQKDMIMLFLRYVVVWIPLRLVFRKQFSTNGATMALMRQMSLQAFPWRRLNINIYIAWCASGILYLSAFAVPTILFVLESGAQALSVLHWVVYGPLGLINCPLIMGSLWLVSFSSRLHQHELLCYADALAQSIENDGDKDTIMPLQKTEAVITGRLR